MAFRDKQAANDYMKHYRKAKKLGVSASRTHQLVELCAAYELTEIETALALYEDYKESHS